MKKLTLLFVSVFIIQGTVFSQGCLPAGITFTTQEQIDNFQTNNPNCTEIEGNVEIDGDDITNLNGLSVVTSIGGYLRIRDNDALTSLTGIDNLTSIGGSVRINRNDALTSLSGLDNVDSIGGNLYIYENYTLTSLTGLDNLTSIGGNLYIYKNDTLTSLTGLDNLTSIGGYLRIQNNDALTSLSGLDNVTSIGGSVRIQDNDALTSLSGLDNIDADSITNLFIKTNASLSTCEVQSICDYIASPSGYVDINDNATGCNSQAEVEAACLVRIPDINVESKISIYPNPATDKLSITSRNGLKIETINIYNQLGQKVFHRNEPIEEIDISTLGQGIYIIEIITSELKFRQKLIIKK